MPRIRWLITGIVFLILGVIGLFLPILQGILFIVIGLMCLSKSSASVRLKKIHFKKRFPRLGAKLFFLEEKARDWRKRKKDNSKE